MGEKRYEAISFFLEIEYNYLTMTSTSQQTYELVEQRLLVWEPKIKY